MHVNFNFILKTRVFMEEFKGNAESHITQIFWQIIIIIKLSFCLHDLCEKKFKLFHYIYPISLFINWYATP